MIDCHCHVFDPFDKYPLAQALIATRPDRCVWGSNWPHPVWNGPMPNDGDLLDLFCDWTPDAAVRKQVLVTHPETLYGLGVAQHTQRNN